MADDESSTEVSNTISAVSTLFWGLDGETWDGFLIYAVAAATLAAGAIGVSTLGSVTAHKREAAAAALRAEHFKTEAAGRVADATKAGIEAGERAGHAQAGVDAANVEIAKQMTLTAQAQLGSGPIKGIHKSALV